MLIVIALGGNALLRRGEKTMAAQFRNAAQAADPIAEISKRHRIVLTHGNGAQIGNILIRNELALGKAYKLPLSVAVAESQGEIGYVIEQSLMNVLQKKKIRKPVVSLLTQVIVDKNDPAFKNPTKPVGPFYSKKQAAKMRRRGLKIENFGDGWRRVVPSPKPKQILECKTIRDLAKKGNIVIAAGGGGIPVYREKGKMSGVDAVIDKDRASSVLAAGIKADAMLLLTGVDYVYLNYRKNNQRAIKKITLKEAEEYKKQGHFHTGSMLPKIEAAVSFIKHGGKKVIITSPSKAKKALQGKAGTLIVK